MMKKLVMAIMMAVVSLFGVSQGAVCEAADLGYVNFDAVIEAYPGIQDAQKSIFNEQKKLQQDFDSQAAELDNDKKAELQREFNAKLAKKQVDIMQPIMNKIRAAIETVAKENNINQVVRAEAMLYGGKDLTKAVIKAVQE